MFPPQAGDLQIAEKTHKAAFPSSGALQAAVD